MAKKLFFLCSILVAAIFSLQACTYNAQHSVSPPQTYLRVKVCDLRENELEGVRVTVLEQNLVFYTDPIGRTPKILMENRVDETADAAGGNWFCVTLIFEKQGYVPTVLYRCVVTRGAFRDGATVHLLTREQTSSPFVTLVEAPPDAWTEQLLQDLADSARGKSASFPC